MIIIMVVFVLSTDAMFTRLDEDIKELVPGLTQTMNATLNGRYPDCAQYTRSKDCPDTGVPQEKV